MSRVASALAATLCLVVLVGCGGGDPAPKPDFSLKFRCTACDHSFSHEWKELQKMKKQGRVIVPEGELMRVECPECGEIKGMDSDWIESQSPDPSLNPGPGLPRTHP